MKCDQCDADAIVVLPGSEEPIELTHHWCLACAQWYGFPWLVSEESKPRRKAVQP